MIVGFGIYSDWFLLNVLCELSILDIEASQLLGLLSARVQLGKVKLWYNTKKCYNYEYGRYMQNLSLKHGTVERRPKEAPPPPFIVCGTQSRIKMALYKVYVPFTKLQKRKGKGGGGVFENLNLKNPVNNGTHSLSQEAAKNRVTPPHHPLLPLLFFSLTLMCVFFCDVNLKYRHYYGAPYDNSVQKKEMMDLPE